jgi:hypothetical protein
MNTSKKRLQKILDILKFVLTLDDERILKLSIESVIDLLEEEISSKKE